MSTRAEILTRVDMLTKVDTVNRADSSTRANLCAQSALAKLDKVIACTSTSREFRAPVSSALLLALIAKAQWIGRNLRFLEEALLPTLRCTCKCSEHLTICIKSIKALLRGNLSNLSQKRRRKITHSRNRSVVCNLNLLFKKL